MRSIAFRVVIPARFDSARLPGKVLLAVAGRPLLDWVHRCARRSAAREIVIATDDTRIAEAARGWGAEVALTAASHGSGTDRIAEVARARNWAPEDIVVNLQADEPLMPPVLLDQVAALLAGDEEAAIATLASPLAAAGELSDPNVVKVVCDVRGRALYFSRAAIPWDRAAGSGALHEARRHVGLYAYRVRALHLITALPASRLESMEKLEQLRSLENGLVIRVGTAQETPGPDVNTADDLARVEAELAARLRSGALSS